MKAVFLRVTMVPLLLGLGACTTANYPTEATRFHAGQPIQRGQVAIQPFATPDGAPADPGPEFDVYARAVAEQLARLGWTVVPAGGSAEHVALIGVDQQRYSSSESGPVSVGVGGGTGGWHSGAGVGLGFNLGGGRRELATTTLNVRLKRQSDQSVFWEGRSTATVRIDRPDAAVEHTAGRLAAALFQGFPGESGRTIRLP